MIKSELVCWVRVKASSPSLWERERVKPKRSGPLRLESTETWVRDLPGESPPFMDPRKEFPSLCYGRVFRAKFTDFSWLLGVLFLVLLID